jgi:hypothetical protein
MSLEPCFNVLGMTIIEEIPFKGEIGQCRETKYKRDEGIGIECNLESYGGLTFVYHHHRQAFHLRERILA